MKGTGLASRLLQEVLSDCRGRGADRLWLAVWHANGRAIAFYSKMVSAKLAKSPFLGGTAKKLVMFWSVSLHFDRFERVPNWGLWGRPVGLRAR